MSLMFYQTIPQSSFERERWFGITRGDEAFGAIAHSYREAVQNVAESLNVDREEWINEKPIVAHLRGARQESELNQLPQDLKVVRFVPGTIEVIPVLATELSPNELVREKKGLARARSCGWWLGELLLSLETVRVPHEYGIDVLHREGPPYTKTGHVKDMLVA